MTELLQNLLKLQTIEFGEAKEKGTEAQIPELRGKIPAQILAHYDRLVARGKKGMAIVRDQVCTGCHMRLPIGTINTLMQDRDIQLCDSCGRYLVLEMTPAPTAPPKPVEPAKPAKRGRKKKAPADDPS